MDQFKKFFQDSDGNYVIAQTPNLTLILAFLFYWLQFIPNETVHTFGQAIFILLMVKWSLSEISFGDSPFRKVLGLVVLCYFLYSILNSMLS